MSDEFRQRVIDDLVRTRVIAPDKSRTCGKPLGMSGYIRVSCGRRREHEGDCSPHPRGEEREVMELEAALQRANSIINWMSRHIGIMTPPDGGIADLNEHWLFIEKRRL